MSSRPAPGCTIESRRILRMSATELARRIRSQELSSVQVVSAHIARVREVNEAINAMVVDRFDLALEEASRVDEALRAGAADPDAPFLGVPYTQKESFALTGMPNTSGLVSRKGPKATSDATATTRLRRAGAIPIGVTNISELCMYMESDNRVYGRTNNPYDTRRIAGGSSGGEGAIIAAGASPFGLGSDIGGSIRLPSFFNGIFGHKPTGGLVAGTGQFPFASGAARRYLTTGPMARRAEDLLPLLRIMAGPDGHDSGCLDFLLPETKEVDVRTLQVLVVPDNGAIRVCDAMRAAQERCADALSRRGARVRTLRIAGLRKSFEIWSSMLSLAGGPSFASLMGGGEPIRSVRELGKWAMGRSDHTFPAIGLALLEKLPAGAPDQAEKYHREGQRLRAELVEAIGPHGVMLYPPYPTPAPRHYESIIPPFKWVYTAIFNAMEMPSTQVPLGLDAAGLPLGTQVIGVHGNDALTIAVARLLEEEFGGWVPAPDQIRLR